MCLLDWIDKDKIQWDGLSCNPNAFDLLKEASEKLTFPIKSKTYDIGVFVESINGIDGGKDNKYWSYYK